jgi:hypothetical protein
MKSVFATLVLTLASATAFACPGSNLMTFKFKGQDAFILNMQTGKIARAESNQNVVLMKLNIDGRAICVESPASRSRCSNMFPALNITGQPGNIDLMGKAADLQVTLSDGRSSKTISIERFPGLARSARGCGPVVE